MFYFFLHLAAHAAAPFAPAYAWYRNHFWRAWLIMAATIAVDLDHLFADPVYDPNRCSIGFHPLHSYVAIALYCILLLFPRLRLVALGLLLHMAVDLVDCWV